MDINKELLTAMQILIEKNNKTLAFDVTRSSHVKSIPSTGYYTIELDGSEYTVKSEFTFNVNEDVKVLIMQNNIKNLYLLPNR